MKPEHDTPNSTHRLADALLREHARLGDRDDEVLVRRVLQATVDKPARLATRPAPRVARREWVQVALGAAAVITLVAAILSLWTVGESPEPHTFRLTVRFAESSRPVGDIPPREDAAIASSGQRSPATSIPPRPAGETIASVTLEDTEFNRVSHYDNEESVLPNSSREETLTITAEEIRPVPPGRAGERESVHYRGNVVVTHDDFVLRASAVDVFPAGEEGNASAAPRLVAFTAELTHYASSSRAVAGRFDYDTLTGALTASDVLAFSRQAGGQEPDRTWQEGGRLVFYRGRVDPLPTGP